MTSKPHPPLMKKHSQTDLISRLKSRKILGVGGEDDDGEVHRSKVRLRHAMFYSSQLSFLFFFFFFSGCICTPNSLAVNVGVC